MKFSPLILAILCIAAVAKDEPRVVYVGDGRSVCHGNSAQCAQTDTNNRAREQQRQYESDLQRYEADRYIRENRQREQEKRNRN